MDNILVMGEDVVRSAPPKPEDLIFNLETLTNRLEVDVKYCRKEIMEFDLIGMYPALVNAFRRILISEVPTMAIEKVTIHQNKTVMQDEVLAHRLGLIPLKANPKLWQSRQPKDEVGTDVDTLRYELHVKCTRNPHCRAGYYQPEEMYLNHTVTSKDIKWVPFGGQARLYKEEDVGPVNDDITILKMRPGHELHVTMTAIKSIGRDHAKFSPVGTASYRLHPYVHLNEEIEGEAAARLKSCFSPGVITLEKINNKTVARVEDARKDMCSRNVLNEPDLKNKVVIGRVKDHYIFTIESVTNATPDELFRDAIKIMKKKCVDALAEAKNVNSV